MDFIYISHSRGSQSDIATLLNDKIETVSVLFATHDRECVDHVFRVICHYFFPPCGNITHTLPPHSLCQEECVHVQSTCGATWQAAELAFGLDPFINCNDTSRLLFPLPNCCTGAGITIPTIKIPDNVTAIRDSSITYTAMSDISITSVVTLSTVTVLPEPSSPAAASRGATIGIVVTVVVLLVAAVTVVVLVIFVNRKLRKREQVKRVQLDILAR